MKALVCMLSAQHVPNLLSVHHLRPDRLVLVVTTDMAKRRADAAFLDALAHGQMDYRERYEALPIESEDNIPQIRAALEEMHQRHPGWQWIANLTGGTKPMSIAAYEFFKQAGARLLYINASRPAEILGVDGGPPEVCQHRPTVQEFLAGYGFSFQQSVESMKQSEARDLRLYDCARVLAEHATGDDLLKLPDEVRQDARDKGLTLAEDHLRPWPGEVTAAACAAGIELRAGGALDKYAVRFLTGEWLEVFLFGLLRKHAGPLGLWDAHRGVKPVRGGVSNDLDVAFMRDYQMQIIECKTGPQEHDAKGDVLFKIEAVRRQYGALRVRSYLATTSDNVLDRKGAVRKALAERAGLYDCRILARQQIQQLAAGAQQLAAGADDPQGVRVIRAILFNQAG